MTVLFILLLAISVSVSAAEPDKAKNLFESGYYTELIGYTQSLDEHPENDFSSSLFRAVSLYRTSRYRESRQLLYRILSKTSDVEIKDRSLYFVALNEIKLDALLTSASLLSSLVNSSVAEVSSNSRELLKSLIYYKLKDADLKELAGMTTDSELLSYIGQTKNALKILGVLPLTGIDKEAGQDILNGMEFAIRHLKPDDKNIFLDIVNSESRITSMTRKVLERLNSSNYDLVIGELRSNPTAALAGITGILNIPLLSPTATASDISSISENVFQINTTSYTLGKTMAEFAIDSLNYRTFAILAPMTEDGNESVAGFTDKVIEKGCAIISMEWYFDHYNLNRQLQRTRERVLEIDSLDRVEYMTLDSIKAVPAGIIEAFFLPVPNSEIESVLSQVAYYNFKAKPIGTYGWDDLMTLNKMSSNAEGLVFARERGYDINNNKYTDFAYRFNREANRNPRMLEITGYSMIEMILSLQLKDPGKTLNDLLSQIDTYYSVSGTVKLKGNRSNQSSDLYSYRRRSGLSRIDFSLKTGPDSLASAKKDFNKGYVYSVTNQDSLAAVYYLRSLEEYISVLDLPDSLLSENRTVYDLKRRIGNSFYEMRDMENASVYFTKFLAVNPRDREIVFKNTVCLAEDDPDLALLSLRDFTDDSEFSSDAYYEIGIIYLRMDDKRSAIDYFSISAELNNKMAKRILDSINASEEETKTIEFDW